MTVQRRGWRYFATRLNGDGTETLVGPDLPLENVEIEDVLSGDSSLTGSLEPAYARLRDDNGIPILTPWSTAIYAENDGVIRGGGIVMEAPVEGPRLDLEVVGFTGYLRDLPYTGNGYKGIHVDPLDVLRVIWAHAQSYPGGNLGLDVSPLTTNGAVDIGTELEQVEFDTQSGPVSFEAGPYKLNWYSNHDLAGDIEALASETPFDYHERHYWDGDTIVHKLDLGYPRIGRRREDLRFVFGVNVFETPEIARSGETYASGTMVLGAGEGASMIKSIREPVGPRRGLRRVAVVIDDTIKSKVKADKRADAENQWRSRIDDLNSVAVKDHSHARLGAAQVGDEIRIEGQGDWLDIDMWVRILSISFQPENGNYAVYSVARTDKLMS